MFVRLRKQVPVLSTICHLMTLVRSLVPPSDNFLSAREEGRRKVRREPFCRLIILAICMSAPLSLSSEVFLDLLFLR